MRRFGESGGNTKGTQVRPSSSCTAAIVRVGRSWPPRSSGASRPHNPRSFERTDGVVVQRLELDPLDRTEFGDELVGLANGRNRNRFSVQLDLEGGSQRRFGFRYIGHGLILEPVRF